MFVEVVDGQIASYRGERGHNEDTALENSGRPALPPVTGAYRMAA